MEKAIERILSRKYPELEMGWHLPLWAKVVDNGEALAQQTATEQRPVYAVSVRILDRYGNVDAEVPVINDVLLPVPAGAANQRGQWSKPLVDTVVELAFAYGSPAHPFIRSILPHGLVLPSMGEKDQRWQQSEKAYIQVNETDEWEKTGLNDLTKIENNLTQRIGNVRDIIAKKHWAGSETENIYKLLHELMITVSGIANIAANHGHPYTWSDPGGAGTTSPPTTAGQYTAKSNEASNQAARLQPLLK
ncbi:hypothetical protein [Marinomonas atlantica]|uniref:hypothetical protein n=1 Tax=Marinomonas atlantica TaxID=1806668 RepID=UPI000833D8BC|nr:hypothetical protein [Marinomonas atlantica]